MVSKQPYSKPVTTLRAVRYEVCFLQSGPQYNQHGNEVFRKDSVEEVDYI